MQQRQSTKMANFTVVILVPMVIPTEKPVAHLLATVANRRCLNKTCISTKFFLRTYFDNEVSLFRSILFMVNYGRKNSDI